VRPPTSDNPERRAPAKTAAPFFATSATFGATSTANTKTSRLAQRVHTEERSVVRSRRPKNLRPSEPVLRIRASGPSPRRRRRPEADSEGYLDEQVRQALSTYHRALKAAEETLKPFAVDGLSVTHGRREMLAGVLDQLHEAEDNYDAAIERAGRLAPHRMRPRRFLIQHLDMGEGANGSNWTAYRQTLQGAMAAADAVFDPSNLAVRQEIQDSKTGSWQFRGGGHPEWSQPTRQRVEDFDMETMLASGESGRHHPEQEQASKAR
jgi:hypothetical protein